MKHTVSGVLVLNKPVGISSRQALDRVAGLLPGVKSGHAGTLDPMASGVLVACIGKATRLIPFVQRMRKEYHATLRLGQRSSTHDLEAPVEEVPFAGAIDAAKLEACLARFRGAIAQVPPQHSAVHVAGQRAYELARQGKQVELKPRTVQIERLNCTRFEFPFVDLEIECGSGTYVRSLVRDIGEELGCGAVMTQLVRTAIGAFRLQDAIDPDSLTKQSLPQVVRPAHEAVRELPIVRVPSELIDDVRHGRRIDVTTVGSETRPAAECVLVDDAGQLIAVAELDAASRTLHPRVVLVAD